MSDPSHSLVSYISSWRERRIHKSKSESENVDDLGFEFIEAKDINEGKMINNLFHNQILWVCPI